MTRRESKVIVDDDHAAAYHNGLSTASSLTSWARAPQPESTFSVARAQHHSYLPFLRPPAIFSTQIETTTAPPHTNVHKQYITEDASEDTIAKVTGQTSYNSCSARPNCNGVSAIFEVARDIPP